MGRYDDIDPDSLKGDLTAFARLILRLEKDDRLLEAAPEVQRLLGDLRQKLFAYEVRAARHLEREKGEGRDADDSEGADEVDPSVRESLRVVREALERERDALEEWGGSGDDGPHSDDRHGEGPP